MVTIMLDFTVTFWRKVTKLDKKTFETIMGSFSHFELYFYLDTVNLSDKIIILLQSIITVTIYFNLYKHDLKFKSKIEKNKEILLYIDAVCVLSIQRKKLRQPFRKDWSDFACRNSGDKLFHITAPL